MATYVPDGYIVVYAIDDSESLQEAERILSYLKSEEILHRNAVIMVANKTDLVRSRVISTNGKLIIIWRHWSFNTKLFKITWITSSLMISTSK